MDCVTGPHVESQEYAWSQTRRRSKHTVSLLDESSALVSSHCPFPFPGSLATGWVLLQIVHNPIFKSTGWASIFSILHLLFCPKVWSNWTRMFHISPKSRSNSCQGDASTAGSAVGPPSWDVGCVVSILPEIQYREKYWLLFGCSKLSSLRLCSEGKHIYLISAAVKIIKTCFVKGLRANLPLKGLEFCKSIAVLDINPVSSMFIISNSSGFV